MKKVKPRGPERRGRLPSLSTVLKAQDRLPHLAIRVRSFAGQRRCGGSALSEERNIDGIGQGHAESYPR